MTYQTPRMTLNPAAFAAGRISLAVLHSAAEYVRTILLLWTVLIALKSAAQSDWNLQLPSVFLSPRAKPRLPAAVTTAGAAARARGMIVEKRIVNRNECELSL